MRVELYCLAWLALAGAAQESSKDAPSAPADALLDAPSLAALRRDPRSLPRSSEGKWKDFGASPHDPSKIPAGMTEAAISVRDRDFPRALVDLYRVLDESPDYPPALYEMGIVYFRLQRYGDAATMLERFVTVVPDQVGKTRALGHCYYSLGDYARGKAQYERVLAVAADEIEALRGLALCEMRLGDPKRALELLGRVLETDPTHSEAWIWKAQILYDLDLVDESLEAAQRARDLAPWQPRPWFLLGRILLEREREEDGLAAEARYRLLSTAEQEVRSLESRLEYHPGERSTLERLVRLHRSTGNVPATRRMLARLVQQSPADVDLRIFALDVLESMGDGEGAKIAARAMEQRCPGERKVWKRLERYYARTGEESEQARAAEQLRRLETE